MRAVIFRNNYQWTIWKNKVFTDLDSIYNEYQYFQKTLPHPARDYEMSKEHIQQWLEQPNSASLFEDTRMVGEDYGDADWFMVAVDVV